MISSNTTSTNRADIGPTLPPTGAVVSAKDATPALDNTQKTLVVRSHAPTPDDITAGEDEVTSDELSKQEERKIEDENRAQRLGSDSVEQRTKLQLTIFSIVTVVVCVFYFCFILLIVNVLASGAAFKKEFAVTGVVLLGMLGSIPTVLLLILMNGLFSAKEGSKDKEDKSQMPDITISAKVATEVAKLFSKQTT